MLKWIWVAVWVPLFYHAGAQNRANYPKAVIACDNMNTVYRGLENPVSVGVPGYMPNEIAVTCTGCLSLHGDNGRYMLKPGADNQIELLVYSLRKRDKSKTISSQKFRVLKIPDPALRLAGYHDRDTVDFAYALRDNLIKFGGYIFIAVMENFDFNVYIPITEFTLTFSLEGKWFEKTILGNRLPLELHQILVQLPKGSTVNFPSVKLSMPGGGPERNLRFTVYKK